MRAVGFFVFASLAAGYLGQDGFLRERDGKSDAAKDGLEGKPAPALSGQWFNSKGQATSWTGLKGKVVLLDFWTHWCGPCREATPRLRQLAAKFKSKGLVVLGIHSDPNKAKMQQAIKDLGIGWPVLFDEKKTVLKAYSADSFPDYYLVDRKGNVRVADLANDEVDRALEMLLSEDK